MKNRKELVLPSDVAEYIKIEKKAGFTLYGAYLYAGQQSLRRSETMSVTEHIALKTHDWIIDGHQEDFGIAWIDEDYTIMPLAPYGGISYEGLSENINKWAIERGLDKSDAKAQLLKLQEEVGELVSGHLKDNKDVIKDSLGDIQVVLIIYCLQNGLNYKECLEDAYNVIKNRKGKLSDTGAFVKEEDIREKDLIDDVMGKIK